MKLASIDIGSNAIRLQVVKVYEDEDLVSFKNLQLLRFPLRLGHDVFSQGEISQPTKEKFIKLMSAFKHLIDLYEVEDYYAVATSAMREARNGKEVSDHIKKEVGMKINVITGKKEASILNKAIKPTLKNRKYVHIDVGGGSTELNLLEGGQLLQSRSFKIGSVRQLTAKERAEVFADMKEWIHSTSFQKSKNIVGIGTGGNINRLYGLANKASNMAISFAELKALRAYVSEFTYEQRMSILKMNPDRADVIVPASEIYLRVLKEMGSDQILVPKVGLKDGLIYELYEQRTHKNLDKIEYLGYL
ncbi:exopolyphosphatase [Zobellia galactanivorans]|uniref:Ppx/GppA phosphatase family protein n=1 Tax=Zobellia galactanivorans (strain DSM 12802 / CCUG 47099 / CIP 106680 / NCIMB 13871 / Dsij) TaxID=63186 RepID=UPI001C074872|nr:exopolyphosphatase [Zobellia galactanivorans]MBU3028485.1 exopolyphosphatase [Zobellia galactanivorans]MDO6809893.1 exopolyphosphatase [Zobellia galactanivorans]